MNEVEFLEAPKEDARRSVLLVEDDKVICGLLQRGLETGGFAVTTAGTAEEAIGLISAHAFDAVVADKTLPGKSGEEVVRAVKDRSPETAVLVMTGYASKESAQQMYALRVDGFLTKPFELPVLTRLLGQMISRLAAQAALRAQITQSTPPRQIRRIAVVDPDPTECIRLVTLIGDLKLEPLVRKGVLEALEEVPAADALVVSSVCLTEEIRHRLLELQISRPDFRVILVSPGASMAESIQAILLNASAQLVQPWTDAGAAEALRHGLDPRGTRR